MPLAFALVIAVEEEVIAPVEPFVATHMIAQDERLEEPIRVGQMPLGRRRVRERLYGRVGVGQRRGEVERERPRRPQPLGERRPG